MEKKKVLGSPLHSGSVRHLIHDAWGVSSSEQTHSIGSSTQSGPAAGKGVSWVCTKFCCCSMRLNISQRDKRKGLSIELDNISKTAGHATDLCHVVVACRLFLVLFVLTRD